ncbi:mitochondrial ribosomal protein subunit domain-containing protein [Paramyrothecium foliicola]|nr:mitochondrial ribosomal protein subunit domain-containing protein [Paramyrothecium foliicola]
MVKMGARAMSPGGALLRRSRMFSIPKPLADPPTNLALSESKSPTMTKAYPQHQAITSPLSSREKGDWGFKRPFPLKSTMATTTPLIRVKHLDTVESVTDFSSAADHALSLQKFQEMRVAMSVPKTTRRVIAGKPSTSDMFVKSVFEEDLDFTDVEKGQGDDRRWKFRGPWLARMTEGELMEYVQKRVRPRRAAFRQLLRTRMAEEMTARRNRAAVDEGKPMPRKVEAKHITETQFLDYLHSLRNDRVTLYALVSQFLDLAPLGEPVGVSSALFQSFMPSSSNAPNSPWGKSGPPLSHPSAGISYLRTSSVMENHPVYGPQERRTPVQARIMYPRSGGMSAKLGVGGFIAFAPQGDNEFNVRGSSHLKHKPEMLAGIRFLDTTTPGGAKAYVEPRTATVDPSGKVILEVRETGLEAQLIAKENKGQAQIYDDSDMPRDVDFSTPSFDSFAAEQERLNEVVDELLVQDSEQATSAEKDVVGSSSSYGLDGPDGKNQQ